MLFAVVAQIIGDYGRVLIDFYAFLVNVGTYGVVVELVDTQDLKSCTSKNRV